MSLQKKCLTVSKSCYYRYYTSTLIRSQVSHVTNLISTELSLLSDLKVIKKNLVKGKKHADFCVWLKRCQQKLQSKSKIVFLHFTDLKVLVRQVELQAEWVNSLWQRPGLQLSQREGVLTEPGQHVLHQDDLVTHLRLLQPQQSMHRLLCSNCEKPLCISEEGKYSII